MRITQFSDSIVVSFLIKEESEVFYTISNIQNLIINLIYKNTLCRGSVTYGKLFHDDKFLFGPAFINAYQLESKKAIYPRVIVDLEIIKLGTKFHSFDSSPKDELNQILEIVSIDTDDLFYIDFFEKAQNELDDPDYDMPEYIDRLKSIILEGLNDNKDDFYTRKKYIWLKNKYNNLVRVAKKNKKFIATLTDMNLKSYYKKLIQIR